jgi:hypothetical protein
MAAACPAGFWEFEFMSNAIGASSSSALSYLQSLLQQVTSGAKDANGAKGASASDPLSMFMQAVTGDGASPDETSSSAQARPAGGASCPPFSPDAMSALISAQGQQAGDPASKLFTKLDTDGDGRISKAEFTGAADKAGADAAIADAVFNKIDANGDGAVSQDELAKVDHGGGHHHHMRAGGGGGGQDPLDALTSATDASGATTQTSTNADGSTTTTISYADGSKIDMTTPAAASSAIASAADGSSNKGKFNLLEQLIKLQSSMLTAASSTMSAMA